ncbi:MAG: hypothetical protein RBR41_03200 [Desulfovibrio sp.]|uniref:hypothetical protein n=1 Tax=Desulfovibrio sp. TaxID=885 RepID=UPI002A360065|nr:hypothetical protein [Desulfovibrio sp.]MDY0258658.1 hypothetical protein [Desulfovibrio sp.]
MKSVIDILGWNVVFKQPMHGGEWTNIDCKLVAEVCAVTNDGKLARIRKKYSLGWNGKRFASGVHFDDIKAKNPKLFAAICKAIGIAAKTQK